MDASTKVTTADDHANDIIADEYGIIKHVGPMEHIERDAVMTRPPIPSDSDTDNEDVPLSLDIEPSTSRAAGIPNPSATNHRSSEDEPEEPIRNSAIESEDIVDRVIRQELSEPSWVNPGLAVNNIPRPFIVEPEQYMSPDTTNNEGTGNEEESRFPIPESRQENGYHKRINTKALPRNEETYCLETFKKNAMIIFNHENFEGFSKRSGTERDVVALRRTFGSLGFEIDYHLDLSKVKLFEELKKFSEKDFTDYGCVAVVILTHGTGNGLLRARDEGQIYSEMDVIYQFKVSSKPTLLTKPVLLIIQACRGKSSTRGVPVMTHYKIGTDHDEDPMSYYLPVESDMLIIHSAFAGKPSFRPNTGSWFIQTLCSQINSLHNTQDLESIVTKVKRIIAIDKYYMEHNPISKEMDVNKQMPVVTSTLIRKLYLRKFNGLSPKVQRSLGMVEGLQREDSVDCLDGANNVSCGCLLHYFDYMKNCLRHFISEHPENSYAKTLLTLADLENGMNEQRLKATSAAISNYLQTQCEKEDYYKFMFFYPESNEIDAVNDIAEVNKTNRDIIKPLWNQMRENYIVIFLGICMLFYTILQLII